MERTDPEDPDEGSSTSKSAAGVAALKNFEDSEKRGRIAIVNNCILVRQNRAQPELELAD